MKSKKSVLTLDKIITIRQWRSLYRELQILKNSSFYRDYYITHLTWNTGLRASEVAALKWEDIHLEEFFLKVRNGKGCKPRTVFFGESTYNLLSELKNLDHKSSFVFISRKRTPLSRVTVWRRFKEIARRANLPESLTFHSLRHGYATRMIDEGIQLHELKEQLGHTSITTTAVYLHFTQSSREKFKKIS